MSTIRNGSTTHQIKWSPSCEHGSGPQFQSSQKNSLVISVQTINVPKSSVLICMQGASFPLSDNAHRSLSEAFAIFFYRFRQIRQRIISNNIFISFSCSFFCRICRKRHLNLVTLSDNNAFVMSDTVICRIEELEQNQRMKTGAIYRRC